MGLILALARHLPAADAAMKQGKWEKKKFLGEEVRDKTLGLAGLGRIGQEVARRAAGFGMRLVAHDPFVSEAVAASLGVELMSLDDVFAKSDYVSLHLPSTPQTRHLVNAERLAQVAQGHPDHQHRPRRPDRRGRAGRRHRSRATWAAPRSTSSTRSRRSTIGSRCCRRSWRRRTSPHPRAKARSSSAWKPPRRCATSCATASSATPSTSRRSRPRNTSGCSRSSRSARSWARSWRR